MRKKLKNAGYLVLQTSQEFRKEKKTPLLFDFIFPVEVQGGIFTEKGQKKGNFIEKGQ